MTFVAAVGVWGGVRWNEGLKHPDDYPSEHPAHPVTMTRPRYMGKYDVTQEQYQQVVGTNPSIFKGKDNPVETVSWNEAQECCKKLTEQQKETIRLPTEAEWNSVVGPERIRRTIPATARQTWGASRGTKRTAKYGQKKSRDPAHQFLVPSFLLSRTAKVLK